VNIYSLVRNAAFAAAFFAAFLLLSEDIIVDKVDFEDANLKEAFSFLSSKCVGKANILFNSSGIAQEEMPLLTMSFRNIPLDELIRYICMESGMKYAKSDNAFIIGKNIDELYISQYNATVVPATANLANIKECLKAYGVTFPDGSTISYNKKTNTLTVKNTGVNHDIISNIFTGSDWIDVRRHPATEKNGEFTFTDIKDRLKKLKISVDFKKESARTVLQYISLKTREKDPSGRGINIFLCTKGMSKIPDITLSLNEIPAGDAIKYIASSLGMRCKIEDNAVLIIPKNQKPESGKN